jgi:hypothetical protein
MSLGLLGFGASGTLLGQGSLPKQSAVVLDGEVVLPLTAREGLTHGFSPRTALRAVL